MRALKDQHLRAIALVQRLSDLSAKYYHLAERSRQKAERIASEQDLAQACRERYSRPTMVLLWLFAEIAIVACDLAEVLGAAIALQLLFHIPLVLGVVLTGADVLLLLLLQNRGMRRLEALVIVLIATIAALFAVEIFLSRPEWAGWRRNRQSRRSRSGWPCVSGNRETRCRRRDGWSSCFPTRGSDRRSGA